MMDKDMKAFVEKYGKISQEGYEELLWKATEALHRPRRLYISRIEKHPKCGMCGLDMTDQSAEEMNDHNDECFKLHALEENELGDQ